MSTATTNVDHRTRVAAERRQRTRDKLVEHALLVYAEHGAGSSMIQEVIASASVAQGTFYNYFRTHHELLVAVSEQLSNDLLRVIEREVASCKLVDKRLAKGLLLFLRTARDHPVLAHFASHGGLHAAGPDSLYFAYIPRHLQEGLAQGVFTERSMLVSLDMIAGAVFACLSRMAWLDSPLPDEHIKEVVVAILRSLGLTKSRADKLAQDMPAPLAFDPTSLVARASAQHELARAARKSKKKPVNLKG